MCDKPADNDLEITDEMIDAGEDVILGEIGGADLGGLYCGHNELACRVYMAMRALRN